MAESRQCSARNKFQLESDKQYRSALMRDRVNIIMVAGEFWGPQQLQGTVFAIAGGFERTDTA